MRLVFRCRSEPARSAGVMSMTRNSRESGLHQLNAGVVREQVSELRNIGITDTPALQLALSHYVIINTLGGDFWAQECTTFGEQQEFFRTKRDVRKTHLAHMLWCIRDADGFSDFLRKNNTNEFESTYYEVFCAYLFHQQSSSIELIVPQGTKGADFDLRVSEFKCMGDLNVEVKARRAVFQTAKQLSNYLNKCRTQLPSSGPGVIFCKVEIRNDSISTDETIATTGAFLRNTDRVLFVVYCCDATTVDNAIALQCLAIDAAGPMGELFEHSGATITPAFMNEITEDLTSV